MILPVRNASELLPAQEPLHGTLAGKIVDAAYDAMQRAIVSGQTPNLFALHYDRFQWEVLNLIVVPRFAYSLSAIEKRKPLASTARRANWVGCNILLGNIPPDARIAVVKCGSGDGCPRGSPAICAAAPAGKN